MTIEQAIQKLINRNQQLVNRNGITPYTRESEDIINTILAFYHISNDILINQRKMPITTIINNTSNYLINLFDVFPKNSIITPEPSLEFTMHFICTSPAPYRNLITYMFKNGYLDNYRAVMLDLHIKWIESEIDYILDMRKLIKELPEDLDWNIKKTVYKATGTDSFIPFDDKDIPSIIRIQEIGKIYNQL